MTQHSKITAKHPDVHSFTDYSVKCPGDVQRWLGGGTLEEEFEFQDIAAQTPPFQ